MGLCPLLLRPARGTPRKSFIYCNYGIYNVKIDADLCIGYSSEGIGGKNRHRNLSSRPGFRYRRVMFPGHVYREKVYWWWARCWRTARVSTAVTKSWQVILNIRRKGISSWPLSEAKLAPGH